MDKLNSLYGIQVVMIHECQEIGNNIITQYERLSNGDFLVIPILNRKWVRLKSDPDNLYDMCDDEDNMIRYDISEYDTVSEPDILKHMDRVDADDIQYIQSAEYALVAPHDNTTHLGYVTHGVESGMLESGIVYRTYDDFEDLKLMSPDNMIDGEMYDVYSSAGMYVGISPILDHLNKQISVLTCVGVGVSVDTARQMVYNINSKTICYDQMK